MRFLRAHGREVWVYESYEDGFPQSLKNLPATFPFWFRTIHLTGNRAVLNLSSVAVVGSRKASSEALERAVRLGRMVAGACPLVTGLASGVDAAAASGALDVGGSVIGVRPWLLPPNGELFDDVCRKGCVLSHNFYKLHESPPWVNRQFFLRNMIIALLSRAVVVVEAYPEGGTMHMLEVASKGWRPVYILKPPASAGDALKAYDEFVKAGAIPLNDVEDLKPLITA